MAEINHLEIRRVPLDELEQLVQVARQTFAETFSAANSEENMIDYLQKALSSDKLRGELTNENSEFYFAYIDRKVVGYLKVNFGPAQSELKDENSAEIERIYVLREYLNKKIGQKLYHKAMAIAAKKGVEYVWLGVWEKNENAIRFYKKNGFEPFGSHLFKLGNDGQTDILMRRQVKSTSN